MQEENGEKKLFTFVLQYDPETHAVSRQLDAGWPVAVLCHLLNVEVLRHETFALSQLAMAEAREQMQGVVGPDGMPASQLNRPGIIRH